MAILVDKSTRVLVQGLTGREGTFHAKASAAYGTQIVGGVTPGKGGTRFQAFTFKAEWAYDNGMPQWVAKMDHAFSPLHLERLFLGRHKYYHFLIWYREVLSGYIREILLDPRTLSRPYWQKNVLEAMVQHHIKGDRNYTNEIHRVLSIELLHRLFIDAH